MGFKVTQFGAIMVALCLTLSNPIDALQGTEEDDVQRTVDLLVSGSNNTVEIIALFKQAALVVDKTIWEAEKQMQFIQEQIGVVRSVKAKNYFARAFVRYDGVKRNVRVARRKLRSLAEKTKNACEVMELYIEGWANKVDNGEKRLYLKEQLTIMEELIVESIALLTEAEEIYKSAIDNIEVANSMLRAFRQEMKKLVDTTAEKRETLKNLEPFLILGCLGGICASESTTSLAIVEAKLEYLMKDVLEIKDKTRDLINGLQSEERIVQAWRIDAQAMDKNLDKLDLDRFEKLPLYRRVFAKSVVNLRESAEDYLNLPVFVQDPAERRKRSLSEKTLVRKHTRNF